MRLFRLPEVVGSLTVAALLPVSLAGQSRPARTSPAVAPRPAPPAVVVRTPPRNTAAPTMIQVGGPDWRFEDPFATLIGGIDMDALWRSEIVRGALAQLLAGVPGGESALQNSGASGVTRALFSLRDWGGEPKVLVLLTGQVDEKALAQAMNGRLQVRRVDLENVLLGTGAELVNAAGRMNRPVAESGPSALHQSKTLVDGHDFWIAGRIPRMPQTAQVADAIQGFALGFSLRKDLRLDVSLNTASVQMAQEIVTKARTSMKETPEGASLDVSAQGKSVELRFAMDGARLNQALAKAMPASGFSEMFSSLGIAPVSAGSTAPKPAAPAPPRRSAVIYGLDEGPREVPMTRP
jgi:hypothetical protein